MKELLIGAAMITVVIVVGVVATIVHDSTACNTRWREVPHEYHVVGGCLVQDGKGRMIPESSYREVAP